jgi:hypothetical protein
MIMRGVIHYRRAYWNWSQADWTEWYKAKDYPVGSHIGSSYASVAYHLCRQNIVSDLWAKNSTNKVQVTTVAMRFFGASVVSGNIDRIEKHLVGLGYSRESSAVARRASNMSAIMLVLEQPNIDKWNVAGLERYMETGWFNRHQRSHSFNAITLALSDLGILKEPFKRKDLEKRGWHLRESYDPKKDISPEWLAFVDRYCKAVPVAPNTKQQRYGSLLSAGRWLFAEHRDVKLPEHWSRDVAAEYVAYLTQARVGDYLGTAPINLTPEKIGAFLAPGTINGRLGGVRQAFSDIIDWGWIEPRFSPNVAFRLPRTVKRQLKDDPRDLQDDVWAKLVAAALTVGEASSSNFEFAKYPPVFVRAVAIIWVFAALRNDEIRRLETDCIRWSSRDIDLTSGVPQLPTCELKVPANKTTPSYIKPVDAIVGEAVEAWLKIRPEAQAAHRDRKTNAPTKFLFQYRGFGLGPNYLNVSLIPKLCELAGVPESDLKGRITSHRARSTIATQLGNADDAMSMFELAKWLGHGDYRSVLKYLRLRAEKLRKSYDNANYFRETVGRINVLLDVDAIRSGRAALGDVFKYYDLVHGYCGDRFFSRCPHRMACAKCEYYIPKNSEAARILEANAHNERLVAEVPLRPIELEAIRGDREALESLRTRLQDTPTPDGRTPTEIAEGLPAAGSALALRLEARSVEGKRKSPAPKPASKIGQRKLKAKAGS